MKEENISHGNEIMEKEMSFGAGGFQLGMEYVRSRSFVLHTGQE